MTAVDARATFTVVRARGRLRGTAALLGPAFVAAVAYVDPGNFATNFTAGARYGYALIWVILVANLSAMLVQYLSAKAGVATGHDLPELCRLHLPRPVARGLWAQAEIMAMATDLAEFLGAAVGLNLVFHVPLFPAGVITAIVAFGLLGLEQRGYRRFELAVVGLLGIVLLGFLYDLTSVRPSAPAAVSGLVPTLAGGDSLLLVCGIIGATVMPHVVYLHSALTKSRIACRDDGERRELLRFQRLDVVIGLGAAGLINLSMLVVAAALFHAPAAASASASAAAPAPAPAAAAAPAPPAAAAAPAPAPAAAAAAPAPAAAAPAAAPAPAASPGAASGSLGSLGGDPITAAHDGLAQLVGGGAALAFAVALLASGLSSSSVGTYAGQVVMQGFIRRRIPLFLRRAVTMAPALLVLALGLPPTASLVVSQVVLSFGIPFALVPLLLLTRRRDIMGPFVNHRATTATAGVVVTSIIALNAYLLLDTFF